MRSAPIVHVGPFWQRFFALLGCCIGSGIGPFAQRGLDEALGFSIGLRRVWFGSDVAEAELLTGVAKRVGPVAASIVGHDALDLDTQLGIPGHRRLQMGDGAVSPLVRMDLGEGKARGIVDADMNMLPSGSSGLGAASVGLAGSIACDAVSDLLEAAQLFDIEMDQLSGMGALVPSHRLGGLKLGKP